MKRPRRPLPRYCTFCGVWEIFAELEELQEPLPIIWPGPPAAPVIAYLEWSTACVDRRECIRRSRMRLAPWARP